MAKCNEQSFLPKVNGQTGLLMLHALSSYMGLDHATVAIINSMYTRIWSMLPSKPAANTGEGLAPEI
jgi:hypothetical protein